MFHSLKIAAAAAAVTLAGIPAQAQSTERINLVNRSGQTIYSFHASDTRNNSWENNLFGNRTLPNGQTFNLTIQNVNNCMYDFRIEFNSGQVRTDTVNICSTGTYTVR